MPAGVLLEVFSRRLLQGLDNTKGNFRYAAQYSGQVLKTESFEYWSPDRSVRRVTGIFLEGKIPAVSLVWLNWQNLDLRPLLALHLSLSTLTHHRDNVTKPNVRPRLRRQLHSSHAQEGGPRSRQMTCGGPGKLYVYIFSYIIYRNGIY